MEWPFKPDDIIQVSPVGHIAHALGLRFEGLVEFGRDQWRVLVDVPDGARAREATANLYAHSVVLLFGRDLTPVAPKPAPWMASERVRQVNEAGMMTEGWPDWLLAGRTVEFQPYGSDTLGWVRAQVIAPVDRASLLVRAYDNGRDYLVAVSDLRRPTWD